jgi:multidrug efflux pump subunit AcrA (membrane-fusion protein)
MNFKKTKLITALLSCNFFISNIGALEVLEIKMLDEYVITREFPGKLIPAEQSKLAFEIPGKINSINVDIGDEVILGEELAALDGRESLAQLNQSKAKYELASQVLARYQDLRANGHISIQDLDKAQSDQIVAKSQYDFYKVKYEQTRLLAPFNGVIQNRFLDTGSVRGNIATRINKLNEGQFDGLVVAKAAISRLSLKHNSYEFLIEEMLPAASQGHIAIECLSAKKDVVKLLKHIGDPIELIIANAERSFVAAMGGNCLSPIAILCEDLNGVIKISGKVLSNKGDKLIYKEIKSSIKNINQDIISFADDFISEGAKSLICE